MIPKVLLEVFILFICVALCNSACPSSNTTLIKWSTVSAWNQFNASVNISASQNVLLDVPSLTLNYLNIFGTLYVSDALNVNVNTRFISVYGNASLIVGTSSCPITNKVIFSFYGPRVTSSVSDMGPDTFDNQNLGSKGLSVRTNGTLLVNGYWSGPAWTNIAATAFKGSNTLVLREAVAWKAGDQIIVTSTDYSETIKNLPANNSAQWQKGNGDPDQTELMTVASVSGTTVTLTSPLNFTHWAGHYQYAEVGLLTRHIVFQGAADSAPVEFGGHVIMRRANQIQIIGAEFTQMGQKGLIGRYPIHFHYIHDAIGLGYIVKQCSSHHNFQRGLTVHETYGVTIQDVVAYKTNGHMYFLEDGGEHNNTFDHNLGAVAYPVPAGLTGYGVNLQIIPSDDSPSIFWITNPDNTFTNNAAVGARFGFWFSLPVNPIGLTASLGYWPSTYHPDQLQLKEFYNNTAHSSADNCIMLDQGPNPDGTITGGNPFWGQGGNRDIFVKSTAYKCRNMCVWSITDLTHNSHTLVDCNYGIFFNSNAAIYNSTFVGNSGNTGIVPIQAGNYTCGVRTYDVGSAQHSYNNVFVNFTKVFTIYGWISAAHCGEGSGLAPEGRIYNNTYINANPIGMSFINIGKGAFVWNDIDGKNVGVPGGAYVISNNQSLSLPITSSGCTFKSAYDGYVCPMDTNGYMQLTITDQTLARSYSQYPVTLLNGTQVALAPSGTIRWRITDMANHNAIGQIFSAGDGNFCNPSTSDYCESIMYNLQPRRFLTVKFTYNNDFRVTPSALRVSGNYMSPGDWAYVSIPYPTTATFAVQDWNGVVFTRVTSFSQVNTTTYYYDSSAQLLWLFIKATLPYTSYNVQDVYLTSLSSDQVIVTATCPNNLCQPTLANLQTTANAPALPFTQNIYTGTLQNCQVVPATSATTGIGKAQVWFYPQWNEIHIAVIDDLAAYHPTVVLGVGGVGQLNFTLSAYISSTSPARAAFKATPVVIENLYTGNLFVQVNTDQYPNGHLRAQLYCQGTCTKPTVIEETNPCVAPANSVYLFNHGSLGVNWVFSVYNISMDSWGYVAASKCGGNGVSTTLNYGQFQIGYTNRYFTVNATYNYLEFYVRSANGVIVNPSLAFRTTTAFWSSSVHIQDYSEWGQIDADNGFQLVSVPISAFGLGNAFNLTTVIFSGTGSTETFYLDQIRFTATKAVTTNIGASLVAGVQPSNLCPGKA